MADIKIPADLLPRDGRFGCGPSRLRTEQIAAFASEGAQIMGTSHRQSPVKNLVARAREGVADLFNAPEGYEVVLGNGGSTAFWDAAAFCLAENRAQALVHGEFGSKFASSLSAPWLKNPQIQKAEPGSLGEFNPAEEFDLYVYPHNETSTGVIAPVTRVQQSGALMLTDATSAAGGVFFDANETDCYYFAPQKNLGSDGGIWFALMSPAAIERVETIASTDRYIPEFLSLKTALDNSRLNQTLNTPAIATLFFMAEQVDWINNQGGLSWAAERTNESSEMLYRWAEQNPATTPFVANPDHRSPVVVTIDFDSETDASVIAKVMRDNGIVDIEPYRKLGRNQIRVATFTATPSSDVERLIAALEFVMEKI